MRILVAEPVAAEGVELLRAQHDVDVRTGLSKDELAAIIADYDALVVRSQVQVDAELIAAGTRLVVIGRAGVGVDNVDLEAATRAGIVVVNAPTGNTIAAAEHTLALLYALARRIPAADASLRRRKRSQFTWYGRAKTLCGARQTGLAIADARGRWRWSCRQRPVRHRGRRPTTEWSSSSAHAGGCHHCPCAADAATWGRSGRSCRG
jgi:phosphoglycerate dehydrogenase-like enzyme